MLTGNFRTSTPNIDNGESSRRRYSFMPTILSHAPENIRDEISHSKLIMMDINPQAAQNLKDYKFLNRDLFKFREFAKRIKIQILKNAYSAYNIMRSEKGLSKVKLAIYTRPFKSKFNRDLESQLRSIRVVEDRRNSSGDLSDTSRCASGNFIVFNSLGITKNIVLSFGRRRKPGSIKPLKHRYMIKRKVIRLKNNIDKNEKIVNRDTLVVSPLKNGRKFEDFRLNMLNKRSSKHKVIR